MQRIVAKSISLLLKFARLIIAISLSGNFSLMKLAEISGVAVRAIQDVERRDNCRVSAAIKLAEALDVALDEL